MTQYVHLEGLQYLNHYQETDLSSVITLSLHPRNANLHPLAQGIVIQAETQNIRYTLAGETPVAGGLGFLLRSDRDPVVIWFKGNVDGISFIEETSGAVLNIASVKRP